MTTNRAVKSIFCSTDSVNKYYFQLQPEQKAKYKPAVHLKLSYGINHHPLSGSSEVWGPIVLCKTCSVLLCVLEQPKVDAGSSWELLP